MYEIRDGDEKLEGQTAETGQEEEEEEEELIVKSL